MRNIVIDSDTSVGYIYKEKSFFVENKGSVTKRLATVKEANDRLTESAHETKEILDIVAPANTVTENDLITLATTYELIKDLSFTYSNDGSYIYSIQFNDYKENPIVLDAEKKKIYIMNTGIIYDLPLNDSKLARLQYIQSYYYNTLGLKIEIEDLRTLYDLLISYYSPTCYNAITTVTNADGSHSYYYNDFINLSNYDGTAKAVYSLHCNPNNEFSDNPIGSIVRIEENAITCTTDMSDIVHEGDILSVTNTNYSMGAYSYSSNSDIKVAKVEQDTIYATENLPSPFAYTPAILYIAAYKTKFVKVDRDQQSITLTNSEAASPYLAGDKIRITGTEIQTEYETITIDGEYTIQRIEDNVMYTTETPPTNYEGDNGYVCKPISMEACRQITISGETSTVYTEDIISDYITVGTDICVSIPVADSVTDFLWAFGKVTGVAENRKSLGVGNPLGEGFTASFGELNSRLPSTLTEISILASNTDTEALLTSSDLSHFIEFPLGKFNVDNYSQAINYLQLKEFIPYPTTDNFTLLNKEVPSTLPITLSDDSVSFMTFLGTSSVIYS